MTLGAPAMNDVPLASGAARPHVGSTSTRWWNLDWSTILPWQIGAVSVEHGSYEEVLPFLKANYERLFGALDPRFVIEEMNEAKRRFWAEGDVFIFRREGQTIGYWGGHPSDWSTYYCRTMSILPEFREGRLASELSSRICQTLAPTDVARIEVDTSIANVPMARVLQGLGFVVTSTIISERWGTMLRFTKHLREADSRVFNRQYVYVPELGRDPDKRREP